MAPTANRTNEVKAASQAESFQFFGIDALSSLTRIACAYRAGWQARLIELNRTTIFNIVHADITQNPRRFLCNISVKSNPINSLPNQYQFQHPRVIA